MIARLKQIPTAKLRHFLLFVVPAAVVIGGLGFYIVSSRYVSTDDAYIKADKLYVSAEVSGRVTGLPVQAHQLVHRGDLLFTIDDAPYRMALDAAEATMAQTEKDIRALKASYRQKQTELKQARTDVAYYRRSYARASKMSRSGFSSDSALDDARHRLDSARLHVQVVQRDIDRLLAKLGSPDKPVESYAAYRKAKAARDRAALDLQRTRVRADMDGEIGPLDIEPGDYVEPGRTLFAIVSTDHYVDAHLKETALTHVEPGQRAEIRIDTYPGRVWPARVASISPATGAEFALLPPENSSGNWVKVVQRVTVRLRFDDPSKIPPLRSGLSVTARIYIHGDSLLPAAVAGGKRESGRQ